MARIHLGSSINCESLGAPGSPKTALVQKMLDAITLTRGDLVLRGPLATALQDDPVPQVVKQWYRRVKGAETMPQLRRVNRKFARQMVQEGVVTRKALREVGLGLKREDR